MSKNGLTEQEIPDKCETKELTRVNSEATYTGLQLWNEDIWFNVAAFMSIGGQGNGLIGDYMPAALYATICPTPYQKPTNPGNNPSYSTGATYLAYKSIKDNWERSQFEFVTHNNCQHLIKK